MTIPLTLVSFTLAMVLAVAVALVQYAKVPVLSQLARFYIWVIRGTPLMLQMFAIYFAPYYVFGISLTPDSKWTACVVAFIINYAGYFAEIYRSGLQSIPRGQYEAAEVLGYSRLQTFLYIVMPQVAKRILPAMGNEIITLVKDTSLARIIALQEVIWAGQAFMKGSHGIHGAIWPLFFTGVYYLVFSGILTLLLGWAERKLDYFKA